VTCFPSRPYEGRAVVVTGAAGTIGQALVARLLDSGVAKLVAIDHNESEMFLMAERLQADPRFQPYVVDIRDSNQLTRLFRGAQDCFHMAALKHVMLSERSPFSAVQTNVVGVENIINAALENRLERVLFASSDKAVNPTNVMGTSKLMGERLFAAAHDMRQGDDAGPVFATSRFGNVAGSRGSVIPVFERQIAGGGPVTVTDREMTRFMMTIDEAVSMLMECLPLAQGGEVFVSRMPVVRVDDLAHVMVDLLAPIHGRASKDIEVREIGAKPGEKLYEELTTSEEVRRTIEYGDYFIVLPPFAPGAGVTATLYLQEHHKLVGRLYNSQYEEPVSRQALRAFLLRPGVLTEPARTAILAAA